MKKAPLYSRSPRQAAATPPAAEAAPPPSAITKAPHSSRRERLAWLAIGLLLVATAALTTRSFLPAQQPLTPATHRRRRAPRARKRPPALGLCQGLWRDRAVDRAGGGRQRARRCTQPRARQGQEESRPRRRGLAAQQARHRHRCGDRRQRHHPHQPARGGRLQATESDLCRRQRVRSRHRWRAGRERSGGAARTRDPRRPGGRHHALHQRPAAGRRSHRRGLPLRHRAVGVGRRGVGAEARSSVRRKASAS